MTILCLHTIDPDWRSSLALPPDTFEEHCSWLVRHRSVVGLDEAVGMLDASGRLPRGVVALTFDDGFASLHEYALPILRRYSLPATVFLVAQTLTEGGRVVDWVEPPPRVPPATLSRDQIREMQDSGIRFASHSYRHATLTDLDEQACTEDLRLSREILEDVLDHPVGQLAYPRGRHDERVRRSASAAGYTHAYSLPESSEPTGRYAIPRVGIYPGNGVPALRIKCSRPYLPIRTSGVYNVLRRRVLGRPPPISSDARDRR